MSTPDCTGFQTGTITWAHRPTTSPTPMHTIAYIGGVWRHRRVEPERICKQNNNMAKNTATSKVSIANMGPEEIVECSVQISNLVIDARPPIHHTATLLADDSPPLSVCTPEIISDPTCHKPKKRKRNVHVKLQLYFV
jgi:hypothetical protein